MIVVPDKFIFLNNPHTGTRSCVKTFNRLLEPAPPTSHVHTNRKNIPLDTGLPIYTVIRNPLDWFYAFYWPYMQHMSVMEYLDKFHNVYSYPHLNLYKDIATDYFVYENGLEFMFEKLGYPNVEIPRIGSNKVIKDKFDYKPSENAKIVERFQDEIKFYNEIKALWEEGGHS